MSDSVYGYIHTGESSEVVCTIRAMCEGNPLGVFPIHLSELYNFPQNLVPSSAEGVFSFSIGHSLEAADATYLIDGYDYDPIAEIGLPTRSKDRIELLIDILGAFITLSENKRVIVAITDSSQIENTKDILLPDLERELIKVVADVGPPDTLYVVTENSP